MSITKTDKGSWLVDIQPEGRGGKRYRKTLPTKAEALRWEATIKNKVIKTPDWQPEQKDLRKLSELLKLWHDHHGKTLKAEKNTYGRLKLIAKRLNDPYAQNITTEMFSAYRQQRLEDGITPNGVNREHAYLRGVFNELIRIGHWKRKNPVASIKLLKIDENELSYLTEPQIKELFKQLEESRSKDVLLVASVCLATGARWSEAAKLSKRQIKNNCISFTGTKSGKNRTVPIPETLAGQLITHKPEADAVLFGDCYSAFIAALDRTAIQLPDGQSTHVLRHTFASHFMINGGNILSLQKILGHQSLIMTMRYAHLSPEHLEEARLLSPYAKLLI
jgi:integrase